MLYTYPLKPHNTLRSGCCYYIHFTDGETEARGCGIPFPVSHSSLVTEQNLNPGLCP